MELSKKITKLIFEIIKVIVIIIGVFVLTIGFAVLGQLIQQKIFVHDKFILWTVHDSSSRVMFLFEIIIIAIVFYIRERKKSEFQNSQLGKLILFMKKNRGRIIPALCIAFLVIIYYMIFNVTVFYSDKLVNYSFTMPHGKNYSYSYIKSIDTGFYRKKVPFSHSKGDFYYIIQMKDGRKINLNSAGGTKDDKDTYLTILEFDRRFVNAGIPKTVDKEYFYIEAKNYDKIYSDRIKSIVDNVK